MLCHVIIKDRELIGFYFDNQTDESDKKIHRDLISCNDDMFIWDKEIDTDCLGSSVQTAPVVWEVIVDGQYYGTYKTLHIVGDIICMLSQIIKDGMSVTIVPRTEEQALYDQIFMKPLFEEFRQEIVGVIDQLVTINCTGPCIICPARIPKNGKKMVCSLLEAREIIRGAIYGKEKEN